jgi:hypothetical protein
MSNTIQGMTRNNRLSPAQPNFTFLLQQPAPPATETAKVEQKDGVIVLHGIPNPALLGAKTSGTIKLLGLESYKGDTSIIFTVEYNPPLKSEPETRPTVVVTHGERFEVQNARVFFSLKKNNKADFGNLRLEFDYPAKEDELSLNVSYLTKDAHGKASWVKDPKKYILQRQKSVSREEDMLERFENEFSCNNSTAEDDYNSGKAAQKCDIRKLPITIFDLYRLRLPYKGMKFSKETAADFTISIGDYIKAAKEAGYIQ